MLVQICCDAGRRDITVQEIDRFLDRELGDTLQDLIGDDGLSDDALELVAAGGGSEMISPE
ncbi:hypothetical protein [Puniceibacterium sediminis]|uniref:Uncharacterized protein n=1 Tax=Puniceibacterium sediminis TaxID=1608407 RepID=A0A238ZIM4_9RHOB|nr:hypothetical protein [Puniceibacterium sediminis]SNR83197.1 hypothetical protein SAMN06265370_13226 [Puniceibacterium sediminis]